MSSPLQKIHEMLRQALVEAFEIAPNDAELFCAGFTRQLGDRIGGDRIYLARRDNTVRNAAIRAEFDGDNIDALAHNHGLSRASIYRIVARESTRKV